MPPRPKYSKEEIIDAAYELAREEGLDSVVARAVGARLGTSATPIFTFFDSMDDLKAEVAKKTREYFTVYMAGTLDYTPAFKEYGLRWARFAMKDPHLYEILFLGKHSEKEMHTLFMEDFGELFGPLMAEVQNSFGISAEDAETILQQMTVYANGLTSFFKNGDGDITDEQLSASLSQVCVGLAISAKLRDGSFNEKQAEAMAKSAVQGVAPVRKEK